MGGSQFFFCQVWNFLHFPYYNIFLRHRWAACMMALIPTITAAKHHQRLGADGRVWRFRDSARSLSGSHPCVGRISGSVLIHFNDTISAGQRNGLQGGLSGRKFSGHSWMVRLSLSLMTSHKLCMASKSHRHGVYRQLSYNVTQYQKKENTMIPTSNSTLLQQSHLSPGRLAGAGWGIIWCCHTSLCVAPHRWRYHCITHTPFTGICRSNSSSWKGAFSPDCCHLSSYCDLLSLGICTMVCIFNIF